MTAFIGGLFILAGFLGGAFCICREYGLRIMYLKKMQSVYEYMKYEISYGKVPIPQMLFHIAEIEGMFFSSELKHIAIEMQGSGKQFEELWKEGLSETLNKTPLKREERKLFLCFPEKQGFLEEDAQARALDELLREIEKRIAELEAEQKGKNKMVMSVGVAGGLLLTILLI